MIRDEAAQECFYPWLPYKAALMKHDLCLLWEWAYGSVVWVVVLGWNQRASKGLLVNSPLDTSRRSPMRLVSLVMLVLT